jgi:hypothetical protein
MKQSKIDKLIEECVIYKRDIGIKKYGIYSDFMQEYLEVCQNTADNTTMEMINILEEFFDKWNIETRSKKLNKIISKFDKDGNKTKYKN